MNSGHKNNLFEKEARVFKNKKYQSECLSGNRYPHLVNDLYAVSHFDPSASDTTPHGPMVADGETLQVDLSSRPIAYGGPVNIMTFAADGGDEPEHMWHVGTNGISYINTETWRVLDKREILSKLDEPECDRLSFKDFENFVDDCGGETPAEDMTIGRMKNILSSNFGPNHMVRFGNGLYAVVGAGNILYVQYGASLFAFTYENRKIQMLGQLENAANKILCSAGVFTRDSVNFVGLSLNSNGIIVATLNIGVAIIHPDVIFTNGESLCDYSGISFAPFLYKNNVRNVEHAPEFPKFESISNSVCIDDDNAIYVASSIISEDGSECEGYLRKLVVTAGDDNNVGQILMASFDGDSYSAERAGAWVTTYATSGDEDPPVIKRGRGAGSTPTLMDDGEHKFVVITNGAKQMELVAYWRDLTDAELRWKGMTREAGSIQVSCGYSEGALPSDWIQSEQSVVIKDNGAFVVNNIPSEYDTKMQIPINLNDNLLQASMVGPFQQAPTGAEKFVWNTSEMRWESVDNNASGTWNNTEIPSTSTVPIYCERHHMAIVNGWAGAPGEGSWVVRGYDWDTGELKFDVNFGSSMRGNGAYSLPQFLKDGSLILNSIIGPVKVDLS